MEDIRFAHYRILDTKTNKILTNGGVTLAVGKLANDLYRVAGAKCHEIDHYCKKDGRVRAKGRLFAARSFVITSGMYDIIRKDNWFEFTHKPGLEDLLESAYAFFKTRLNKRHVLVNSGVYRAQLKANKGK